MVRSALWACLGCLLVGTLSTQVFAEGNTMVVIKTSKGDIKLELFADKSPVTVENFLTYVKNGHYDGTIFHRVIDGFMVQGGGMDMNMKEKKTLPPIKNEASNGVSNKKYTVAMARTSDPNSATAQFFINLIDNGFLDKNSQSAGYAVFGQVVEGNDVVDAMGKVKTGNRGLHQDVPVEPITIESVKVVEAKN
jgi:cyclophilin family peptidyl-prolyl cis-trans isomerase